MEIEKQEKKMRSKSKRSKIPNWGRSVVQEEEKEQEQRKVRMRKDSRKKRVS